MQQLLISISQGAVATICRWVGQIFFTISQNWCKRGTYLLQKANRNSYVLCRMELW